MTKLLLIAIGKALLVAIAMLCIIGFFVFAKTELGIEPVYIAVPAAFCLIVYAFYMHEKMKAALKRRR